MAGSNYTFPADAGEKLRVQKAVRCKLMDANIPDDASVTTANVDTLLNNYVTSVVNWCEAKEHVDTYSFTPPVV